MRQLGVFTVMVLLMGCSQIQKFSGPSESERLNAFLEESFNQFADVRPEMLTVLGQKKHYDRLNDYTEAFDIKTKQWREQRLAALMRFDFVKLDHTSRLSYYLFKQKLEEDIADFTWKDYIYPFNQQYGLHTELPSFMMNMHVVESEKDLRDYIARLNEFRRVFREALEQVARSEKARVVPPKFVFPYVIKASKNVIHGRPFDSSKTDSPLYADFKKKMTKLQLGEVKNKELLTLAEKALKESVAPAYKDTIKALKSQARRAKTHAGVWKFPNGSEYYRTQVQRYTTTKMSPDQVHELGLENVKRLQAEMKAVMQKLNYKGSLQQFFTHLRQSPQFYYPNTAEGKKSYLEASQRFYQKIQTQIPKFFRLVPQAGFEIRAVEKFREDSAGVAFYESPSEDGTRPGVYYVNLKNMRNLPKHEAEVVLYHEGAPGHHFQIALAQEMKHLPKFRRFSHSTAYVEGWGLYTEELAKEMGGYEDLYSEFGRLSLELLRAARLVVDTGMHAKRWTREQALKYFKDNLPGALEDQKDEIERYIVMPGQATAYMVGKLKIMELRKLAQAELGSSFDIRDFHDAVLSHGAMPLDWLESHLKETYILNKKGKS